MTLVHGEEDLDTAKKARRPVFVYRPGLAVTRSSPRRKRREVIRTDTRIPVPVTDHSHLIPFAEPRDPDTSWRLPDSTYCEYVCSSSKACQRCVP